MRHHLLLSLLLVIAVLAALGQVTGHGFINYDDDKYVTENPHVQAGLTLKSASWAFTTFHASNWHPLTWLSLMLDSELYALNPRGFHLTNLLLHLVNSLLLFCLLRRMTGSTWKSGLVALIFGVHPLHVESVAWVAERKDVLSTLFWLITMWAYVRYCEKPAARRYLLVALAFVLGLMAKPMLVTLPVVLLLVDYWPLGRFVSGRASRLIFEKVPLLAIAGASSVVTFLAQQHGGALGTLERLPIGVRAANAVVSYAAYVGKMLWPRDLAVPYPHPGDSLPAWEVAAAAAFMVCVSAFVLRTARWRPYLATGWLWYVVTLLPVIGLVQVGAQAMADRYTYVPLTGILIMIAWGVPEILRCEGRPTRTALVGASALIAASALILSARIQVGYWRDSITLFTHSIERTSGNYIAHNNLGVALFDEGRMAEAELHYREALRTRPDYVDANNNLGNVLVHEGRSGVAIRYFGRALLAEPSSHEVHNNLGVALARLGRLEEAANQFRTATRLAPGYRSAQANLARTDRMMREARQPRPLP